MRLIALTASFVAAWTSAATADPLTACDFITQADVERIVGASVSPPMVQELNMCGGYCASLNTSRCEFKTVESKPKEFYLAVELPPYLLSPREERIPYEAYQSDDALVEDVPGFGKDTIWYYDYHWKQSEFVSFPRAKARFVVHQTSAEPGRALANAIAATAIALKKYDALAPANLKGAWKFKSIEGRYSWQP